MRDEIKEFAEMMEACMLRHDGVKADSWKTIEKAFLWKKLREEFNEAVQEPDREELVDLANIAMMLWQRGKD